MFQLSKEEWNIIRAQVKSVYSFGNEGDTVLRSQFVTAKSVQKQRFQPYAFVYPVPPHRFHSPKRGKQVSGTRRNIELCQYHDARKFVAKKHFLHGKSLELIRGQRVMLVFHQIIWHKKWNFASRTFITWTLYVLFLVFSANYLTARRRRPRGRRRTTGRIPSDGAGLFLLQKNLGLPNDGNSGAIFGRALPQNGSESIVNPAP